MTLALHSRPVRDASVEQAVRRLVAEFSGSAGDRDVVRVVRTCRQELSGAPVDALPELVERLARYRLRLSID
ncbi:MAG: uncharacterized protein JWQ26_2040 [Modestobacter sp.]|jgi:hypothetical protein|nr:uncharacterized protein [Modestobacter sp.]HEV7726298.1 hypothetical protein [Modestobacter sp.]